MIAQQFSTRRWFVLAGACLGLLLVGCEASGDQVESDKPQVVSTSTIIADLTEKIGGDEISHQGILEPI
jgi:manganese/iron transport system substrate-binding protein